MTAVDASNNPDKVKYYVKSFTATIKLKIGVMLGMLTKVTFSLNDTLLIGIEN